MSPSDETTTVSDLKGMVREFCEERDWDQFHNPKDLAIGIVTEASELLEILRFKDEAQTAELMAGPRRADVEDELSDTLYFVLRFAQMNGIDLSSALSAKIARNAERYPVSSSKGSNLKYDEARDFYTEGRPI